MSPRTRRLELWGQALLATTGCAGFVVAWSRMSFESPHPASQRALPHGMSDGSSMVASIPASVAPETSVVALPRPSEQIVSAAAIRKSQLPEWMRFRYDHTHLALTVESVVRAALDTPIPLRAIAAECSSKEHLTVVRDLDLTAEVEIQARDVTMHGWGCEANEDPSTAGRICDCILARLPDSGIASVPLQVADGDLVPYEGLLSLRLWL